MRRGRRGTRLDWHTVTFWAALGVAVVLMLYRGLSRDRRIVTVFTPEGRDLFRRILRDISPF